VGIPELEAVLEKAREHRRKLIEKGALKASLREVTAASEKVLQSERALAAAKNEEYAAPLDFPVRWDSGAPSPHLLQSDYRTFLFFLLPDHVPDTNGEYLQTSPSDATHGEVIGLVEFERCHCTKMGTPNDEVLHGHPLGGRGLHVYGAFSVENSNWIKELEAINSVHTEYSPRAWKDLKHFILCFHDCTFECVARGFKVEKWKASLPAMLGEVCRRLTQ
jgi:hypothetical protein